MLFYGYNRLAAVHLECDGSRVENISVCRTLLDDLIIAVRKLFGHHELARCIGVIGVDVHRRRVVDMLHDIFARVGVTHLKANAGGRDNFTRFGVLFNNFNECLKGCVIDEETIYLSVLADEYRKRRKQFLALPALGLLNGIFAVRQILGFGKAILIAYEDISFGFLGVFVAARRFQIYFKFCADLRCFNFGSAVVAVLDDSNLAFDNILIGVKRLGNVVFHGIQLGFCADVQAFGID